jgi:hypothetical protein
VFVALGIQRAMRMRHIVIVACPTIQYFSTLSHLITSLSHYLGHQNNVDEDIIS